MAELTLNPSSPDGMFGTKAGSNSCKSDCNLSAGTSPLNPEQTFKDIVFVRYRDHVMYNRVSAALMQPQIREAVGWLICETETYIIISWDKDAGPPTLRGGDPKASGLVLLKSDILYLKALKLEYQRDSELNLKSKQHKQSSEFAFRPSERKTHSSKGEKTK